MTYHIWKPKYYKTAGVFSQLSGKKIYLKITDINGTPTTKISDRSAYIVMTQDEGIMSNPHEHYRSFEHELSHVLFSTMEDTFAKVFLLVPTSEYSFCRDIVNIVEDYRVDSLWNSIYRGSAIIREKQLKRIAQDICKSDNIIDQLNAARCWGGTDIVMDKYKPLIEVCYKHLKKVERASPKATVVVSVAIINTIIDYIKQQENNEYDSTDASEDSANGNIDATCVNTSSSTNTSGTNTSNVSSNENNENDNDDNLLDKPLSEIFEKTPEHTVDTKLEDITLDKVSSWDTITNDTNELDIDISATVRQVLEEAKKEGENQINEVKKKLNEIDMSVVDRKDKNIIGEIKEIYVPPSAYERIVPDTALINKIKRLLEQIKTRSVYDTDESGVTIDLDNYIQHKISKHVTDVFADERDETSIKVVIMVDLSGSMCGHGLKMALLSCLTLMKAFKDIKGVDIDVIGYSGDDYELDIVKIDENNIHSIYDIDMTPTHSAVQYVHNMLTGVGAKRMVILITDGVTNTSKYSKSSLMYFTRQNIMETRKDGIDFFTFFVDSGIEKDLMRKTYGPENTWEVLDTFDELPNKLYRFVLNKVVKTMKTR